MISTFSRARYLPQAVESVLTETVQDFELIVVDKGSTDETAEALAPYGERLRRIYQENEGRAEGRNRGIREARGHLRGVHRLG